MALVGDTLHGVLPNSTFPPFAEDPETMVQSWENYLKRIVSYLYQDTAEKLAENYLKGNI